MNPLRLGILVQFLFTLVAGQAVTTSTRQTPLRRCNDQFMKCIEVVMNTRSHKKCTPEDGNTKGGCRCNFFWEPPLHAYPHYAIVGCVKEGGGCTEGDFHYLQSEARVEALIINYCALYVYDTGDRPYTVTWSHWVESTTLETVTLQTRIGTSWIPTATITRREPRTFTPINFIPPDPDPETTTASSSNNEGSKPTTDTSPQQTTKAPSALDSNSTYLQAPESDTTGTAINSSSKADGGATPDSAGNIIQTTNIVQPSAPKSSFNTNPAWKLAVGLAVALGVLFIFLALLAVFMLRRRRRSDGGEGFFTGKKSSEEMICEAPADAASAELDGTKVEEDEEDVVEKSELGVEEVFEAPENGRRSPEVGEMFVEPPAAVELVGEKESIRESDLKIASGL